MNEILEKVTRYHCKYCKKDFKTPDRHYCKMNPKLKNCFTCKHLRGWLENENGEDVGVGTMPYPNYPDCKKDCGEELDIEVIKACDYNLQCSKWEEGSYWEDYYESELDFLDFKH